MFFFWQATRPTRKIDYWYCESNLKQVGLAYKIWEGDNDDKFPMEVYTNAFGGPLYTNSVDAYRYYQVMSNEMANPKILICPMDKGRTAATNFASDFNSSRISYFVGLGADETRPGSLLGGDDNLTNGTRLAGGVLELTTNRPADWSKPRHNFSGFIAFTDGSVRDLDSKNLNDALEHTDLATNRLLLP
jgi:hypothetical protein